MSAVFAIITVVITDICLNRADPFPPEGMGRGRGRGAPSLAPPPPILGPPPTQIPLPPPPGASISSQPAPYLPASAPHLPQSQASHNGYAGPQEFIAADPAEPPSYSQPHAAAFQEPPDQGGALPGPLITHPAGCLPAALLQFEQTECTASLIGRA